jgi:helicase
MKIRDLINFGFTSEIIESWGRFGYEILLPVQENAIRKGVLDRASLLITAPTSSGKTFVGEMTAVAHTLRGKKTLYLVPFKAIAEEKYIDFVEKYSNDKIGFIVHISDRDHRQNDSDIQIGNYDIAILTYEKLSSLLVSNSSMLDVCDCLIVDEVQMLMDPDRGGALELLLTKIKAAKSDIQIIALSAVLDELNGFDHWLNADVIKRKDRPIELRQGVIRPDGIFEYREWNTGNKGQEQFPSNSLLEIVRHLLECGEQVIVVRNSVAKAGSTAKDFAEAFAHLPAASKTIKLLVTEADTETKDSLLTTLRHSIAFHHADCELDERRIIEAGFCEGEIKVIVSTTTLSTGVNLPCKTVILADNRRWASIRGNLQEVNWQVGEVRNIFGRAGRLGHKEDFGRGILIALDQREYRQIQGGYLDAPLESLKSTFENKDIAIRILDIVATGFGGKEEGIANFIFQTFAAREWNSAEIRQQIGQYILAGIERCINGKLFEKDSSGNIIATPLGKVCAAKQVSIETFDFLLKYVEDISEINNLDISFIGSQTEEVGSQYYRGMKWWDPILRNLVSTKLIDLASKNELVGRIAEMFHHLPPLIGRIQAPPYTIALLVKEILETHGTSKSIRDIFGFPAADVRKVCLNLSWILDTLGGITYVLKPSLTQDIQILAQCVQFQTPISCRFLNRIRANLNRDEKIKLIEAGFTNEDCFLEKKGSDFIGIISPVKADRIIEEVNRKRTKDYQYWERDHKRRLDAKTINTVYVEAIYTANGIELERAICDMFGTGFAHCTVMRITDQKLGEPDLLMTFSDGKKMAIQVTAKQNTTQFIDSKKAGEVIPQSARFHPNGFMCLGRPDFQEFAKEQALHIAKDTNFKLIPIYILAELYVLFQEGKIDSEGIAQFLYSVKGYVTADKLQEFINKTTTVA